jgi:hypothetical protein
MDNHNAAMPEKVTGYQWGDDNRFIGVYTFDNNADKEEIHLPPRTTLSAPPDGLAADEEAAWDEHQRAWIVRRVTMSHLPDREVPHAG